MNKNQEEIYMECKQCGARIPDGSLNCGVCGTPAGSLHEPAQTGGMSTQATAVKPKRKVITAVIIAAACVFLAACAAGALLIIENANAQRYEKAVAAMNNDPAQAKIDFEALSGYKDSAEMAEKCRNRMDYEKASELMDSGNYAEAEKAFGALGGYNDSETMAKKCRNMIDYEAAAALMKAGKLEEARAAFEALGGYSDSAEQAEECKNSLAYGAAVALMDKGDLVKAKAAFDALKDYKDSVNLALECGERIKYADADADFKAGKYYSAYLKFKAIIFYSDSPKRAEECIQPNPKTGETYRCPGYSKKITVKIKTPNDGYSTYFKIYQKSKLVLSAFIASGKKLTIKLPAGTYEFREAFGINWFGEKDMFGDYGYYSKVVFGKNGETEYRLKSRYIYTLTVRSKSGGYLGEPVGRTVF